MIMLKNMFPIPSVLAKPLSRTKKKNKTTSIKILSKFVNQCAISIFLCFHVLISKKKKLFIILDVFIFRFYNLFMGPTFQNSFKNLRLF